MFLSIRRRGNAQIAACWLLVFASCAAPAIAENPGPQEPAANGRSEPRPFLFATNDDLELFRDRHDQAVAAATRILEKNLRGEYPTDSHEPLRAIEVLGICRSTNRDAVAALCDHLDYSERSVSEPGPLNSFPAARALVAIGGRTATSAIYRTMRRRLDRRELLLRAHVLINIEPLPLAVERIRLEFQQMERPHIPDDPLARIKRENLNQVLDWIQTNDFARKIEFDPSMIPAKKKTLPAPQ